VNPPIRLRVSEMEADSQRARPASAAP
jgi:hypothetical protein